MQTGSWCADALIKKLWCKHRVTKPTVLPGCRERPVCIECGKPGDVVAVHSFSAWSAPFEEIWGNHKGGARVAKFVRIFQSRQCLRCNLFQKRDVNEEVK